MKMAIEDDRKSEKPIGKKISRDAGPHDKSTKAERLLEARTPIPQIRRLLEALAYNEHCERLSLANMGLSDNDLAILMPVLEINTGLKKLNLETNYLSGDFFIKFFQAALTNQTLEEVRAVNQGTSYTNLEEKEIVDGIVANTGLTKRLRALSQVSINLRLQEDRQAVEKAMLRNGDL
ncbi:hypothetical protein TELCIR_19222, partial [Teladorsagia circumcincta]